MLKNPLWLKITDLFFMVGIPGFIAALEICHSSSVKYKISFFFILIVLITWQFVSKFVLEKYKTKLEAGITTLELNYNTGVGEKEATLKLWKNSKLMLLILNAITILLAGLVIYLVFYGLAKGLLKFLGAFLIIGLSYFIAFIIKAIHIAFKKVKV